MTAFDRSGFTVTQRGRAEDALHFARKHEQRVWGSGDHEKARAEVERLEAVLASWPNEERTHRVVESAADRFLVLFENAQEGWTCARTTTPPRNP